MDKTFRKVEYGRNAVIIKTFIEDAQIPRFFQTQSAAGMDHTAAHEGPALECGHWAITRPGKCHGAGGNAAAYYAASWALDLEDDSERRRLLDGHRARRRPITRAGLPATDFTAADEWLISEHSAAMAAAA